MKKTTTYWLLAATMTLASCASDNDFAYNNGDDNVAVTIAATRASITSTTSTPLAEGETFRLVNTTRRELGRENKFDVCRQTNSSRLADGISNIQRCSHGGQTPARAQLRTPVGEDCNHTDQSRARPIFTLRPTDSQQHITIPPRLNHRVHRGTRHLQRLPNTRPPEGHHQRGIRYTIAIANHSTGTWQTV